LALTPAACAGLFFGGEHRSGEKHSAFALYQRRFVTAIYVLINLGILHALPISKLAGSKLAAADAAQLIFGGYSSQIVTSIMLVSLLGISMLPSFSRRA